MLTLKSDTSDDRAIVRPTDGVKAVPRSPITAATRTTFTFIPQQGFTIHCKFKALLLAYMLDSLVRVSRRVDRNDLVRITHDSAYNNTGSTSSYTSTSEADGHAAAEAASAPND